jgi:hypothetical protein
MANDPSIYGNGTTSDDMARTALVDRHKEGENKPKHDPLVKRYWREINRYNKVVGEWYEEGENIEKVYLDESSGTRSRRFALLWANTETLKPAVYTKTPTVMCSRRYRDRDRTARTAAELMERATNTTLELYGVDEVFRMVRDDRLLPGRGTAWVRYEAVIDQIEEAVTVFDEEKGTEVEHIEVHEKLRSEKACVDYVHWQDFGHNVSRIWSDVWLVWRCVYKTQDEVAERFGADVAASLTYNTKSPVDAGSATGKDSEGEDFVKIYEIWDKTRELTSWLADQTDSFMESGPPPISFSGFFPCPEPTYATKTSKTLIPKPDYIYYRDQAKEINDLTDKIANLTEWLIVKGFIPGGPSSIADPLEEALRDKGNKELFVQVDSFTQWTEAGGANKLIDWLPIQNVVAALQAAIQARAQLIQDVFQITGIADVLRGQSDPNETATAVDMRAQTGTRRLRNTKDDLSRFCRDIARLVAEVIAENFSPKSIAEITGYRYTPAPDPMMAMRPAMQPNMANVAMFPGVPSPQMQQMPAPVGHNGGPELDGDDEILTFDDSVIALLRNDKMRSFRVDIETDSTIQADENAEKANRTELASMAGAYLERAAKTVQAAPALANTAGELLMYVIRGHRAGRTLEETIEKDFKALVRQIQQQAAAPKPEDPVITVAKTQVAGEIEKNRIQAQLKAEEQQIDAALEVRGQDLDAAVEIRKQNIGAAKDMRAGQQQQQNDQRQAANDLLQFLTSSISQGLNQPRRVEIERDPATGKAIAAVSKSVA